MNLYDVSGLGHFELYRAIRLAGHPSGLQVTQAGLRNDLRTQIAASVRNHADDPFGFGLPWGAYDSISHGTGLSVMAAEYSYLTHNRSHDTDSRRWLANVSGANALGSVFHRRRRRYFC